MSLSGERCVTSRKTAAKETSLSETHTTTSSQLAQVKWRTAKGNVEVTVQVHAQAFVTTTSRSNCDNFIHSFQSAAQINAFHVLTSYRKIPKISPGAYIFQRPFLRGLFLEGLIFEGSYIRWEICGTKSIELAYS